MAKQETMDYTELLTCQYFTVAAFCIWVLLFCRSFFMMWRPLTGQSRHS
jgi:hypothetical protein